MAEEWFYAVDGERRGPVSLPTLVQLVRTGRITQSDLVWHPDFGNQWKPAREVAQLMIAFTAADVRPEIETDVPGALLMEQGRNVGQDMEAKPDGSIPLDGVRGTPPSVFAAVRASWNRMISLLFKPFHFKRWISIAFCLWVASLGGGVNIDEKMLTQENVKDGFSTYFQSKATEISKELDTLLHSSFDQWLLPLGIAAFVLVLVLLFQYVRCCGHFMFLHRWYHPDGTISESWKRARCHAGSFLRWKIFLALLFLISLGGLGYGAWVSFGAKYAASHWTVSPTLEEMPLLFGYFGGFLLLVLFFGGLRRLGDEWLAPVMYCQQVSATKGWRSLLSLMGHYPFRVVGYFIVEDFVLFWLWVLFLLLVLGSFFLLLIPLFFPVFNMMVLLPILYFQRGVSLSYLSQWRPELVFPER